MKKTTKALLMGALCMLIVGSAFCIAGFCFGFTFTEFAEAVEQGRLEIHVPFDANEELDGSEAGGYHTDSAEQAALMDTDAEYSESFTGIESLDLELSVAQCTIILWSEEEFLVQGSNLPADFQCRKDGKELEIDCGEDDWKFWENHNGAVLELYVPASQCLKKVEIAAGIGEIEVQDGFLLCQKLSLDSGVGACNLSVDASEKVEIEGGIGEVVLNLKGKETDFNFDLDNGVGEVVIGNSHLKQLGADEWIDHDASKTVDIDNGIGSITVHFSEK